jgi:hypothetical protein
MLTLPIGCPARLDVDALRVGTLEAATVSRCD